MEQLSEEERRLAAVALFSVGMKIGPTSFATIERIVEKIGVEAEFTFEAKNWIEYANKKKAQSQN